MSSRDALRRLSRKMPMPPEVKKIMDDLRGEKDMSVAIVASAIVDASLERLLIAKFKSKNKDLLGRLFHNVGPLSSLSGKILVAQAFGVITSPLAEEMHTIRSIRNAFAHAKIPISFGNDVVAREVVRLKLIQEVSTVIDSRKLSVTGKGAFLLAVQIILIILETVEGHGGTADEAIAEALAE
jgi:hypothetical protein